MKDLELHLREAERKAWASLARYKFFMFGYWAAIWVHLNRLSGIRRKNPFKGAVNLARIERRTQRVPDMTAIPKVSVLREAFK